MDQNALNSAMQARAEVISSPVEKGVKIKAVDIQGCRKSTKGFLSRVFKSKSSSHLLCILRQGGIPQDAKQWCSDILSSKKSFQFQDSWLIYVQEIGLYPSDAKMYLASHAMVLSDLLSMQKPNLDSIIWEEFVDSENTKCLIYSVGF